MNSNDVLIAITANGVTIIGPTYDSPAGDRLVSTLIRQHLKGTTYLELIVDGDEDTLSKQRRVKLPIMLVRDDDSNELTLFAIRLEQQGWVDEAQEFGFGSKAEETKLGDCKRTVYDDGEAIFEITESTLK